MSGPQAAWRKQRVHCVPCNTDVLRVRLAQHRASALHRRLTANSYQILPSDEAFTAFLNQLRWSHLHGEERAIFRRCRKAAQA